MTMIVIISTSFLTTVVTTFLINRLYVNMHYHKTNSGYRQSKVIMATKEIGSLIHLREENVALPALLDKYKNSLSVIIYRFYKSFGVEHGPVKVFPLLFDVNSGDYWSFFNKYVRPVKEDISNNSFMGWFNFVHNVKLMSALWEICHCIEDITMMTSGLSNEVASLKHEHPYSIREDAETIVLKIDSESSQYKESLLLLDKYEQLKKHWFRWLALNDINLTSL